MLPRFARWVGQEFTRSFDRVALVNQLRDEAIAVYRQTGQTPLKLLRRLQAHTSEHDVTCGARSAGWIAGRCNCRLPEQPPK